MPYSPPTYRTLVRLSDGGQMGRANPAPQPGGFLKGLPSPFWCTCSFQWQILVYVQENEPATLQGCTATLKARPLNQIAADVILATAPAAEGTPGYFNSFTFLVPRDTFPDLSYSGETMQLYAEIEGDIADVSVSVDVQTTIYQTIEFIGPSGTQAESPFAPVPAGRWMGVYDAAYQYWAYDTVSWPDENGVDCIWENIAASGSLAVTPSLANSTTWYCIIHDYTGAWMTSVSEALIYKQDVIDSCAAFAGPVADATKIFMDGLRGIASQLWTYINGKYNPGVSADWPAGVPGAIADAIDALAAIEDKSRRMYAPAGVTTAFLVYAQDAVTGAWGLADPDTAGCDICELWCSLGTAVADHGMVCEGVITNGAWAWVSIGGPLFLDDNGAFTEVEPTAPGDDGRVYRQVGWVRSATSIRFDGHIPGIVMPITVS